MRNHFRSVVVATCPVSICPVSICPVSVNLLSFCLVSLCLLSGCDFRKPIDDVSNTQSHGEGTNVGGSELPSNFFGDIPLPEGAKVVAVRADMFGDPIVEFTVPSPAQPLNAWYTIESSKAGWAQFGSTEMRNGGGSGSFSHTSEDRFFEVEIEPLSEDATKIIITYRGAGI